MKIFQVTETLSLGGAETFAVRLCNHLAAAHEVYLVVLRPDHIDPSLRGSLHPSVKLLPLPVPQPRLLEKAASGLRRLGIDFSPLERATRAACRKLVQQHRPDAVHTHLFKSDLAFAGLSAVHPFRHVSTIHGDYSAFFHGDADPLMHRLPAKMEAALQHLHVVACLCEEHIRFFADRFPSTTRGKLHLIYNGYAPSPPSESAPALPEGFLFGMVSRGVEKKGWGKLVEAFLQLDRAGTGLVLVGSGPYLDKLKEKVKDPRIIFSGATTNPLEYIRGFDVCVLPTLFPYESLPTVIIEYLTGGRPVIATDVGEIGRMIRAEDGSTGGLLLPFEKGTIEVSRLKEAMERLLDDEGLRRALEAGSRKAAEKFDMNRCTAAYLQLYGQS